ncbi:hypothetical protein [Pseudomonas akapageensis]|uniref:hypothetical protein n=1 Tax=Pseudomonas akapageensis TaxID=2609961 RepID=UPI00140C24E3|nr:hypothetical protein [Pseudomonas akapageensis]
MSGRMPGFFDKVSIDTALIIALASGVFFLGGTVYFEKYYSLLGVPAQQISIAFERKLLQGAIYYFSLLLVLFVPLMLIAFAMYVSIGFDKGRSSPLPYRTRKILLKYRMRKVLARRCLRVIGGGLICIVFYKAGLEMPSAMAERDADNFLKICHISVFSYANGDKVKGCYIGGSERSYYVFVGGGSDGIYSVATSKVGIKEVVAPIAK